MENKMLKIDRVMKIKTIIPIPIEKLEWRTKLITHLQELSISWECVNYGLSHGFDLIEIHATYNQTMKISKMITEGK